MNTFKCSFCEQTKDVKELAGELKKSYEKLIAQKERLEKDLAHLSSLQVSVIEKERKAELERGTEQALKELENVANQVKNNKECVCRSC